MPDTTVHALPNGVKVRGGAYLVEEVLDWGDGQISYRAYDVPARSSVTLMEFFPPGARRESLEVAPPSGWTAQGWSIARSNWLQRHPHALTSFEDNGTSYVVMGLNSPRPPMQANFSTPTNPVAVSTPIRIHEQISSPVTIPQPSSAPIRRLSYADLWPDAWRGAVQGGLLCGVLGVVLGTLAAALGHNPLFSGALRGLLAFPVGAFCGALIGVLRALPSNAPALATASPVSPQQQIATTLAGAGKGALLGLPLGLALMLAGASGEGTSISYLLSGLILFALVGAIGGAVVGFIRIMPRDRSRRL